MTIRGLARSARNGARRAGRSIVVRGQAELDLRRSRDGRADLALFHEFAPPPAGGGHQFLRALTGELERRGLEIELNRISGGTAACLYNSFNLEPARLRRFARADVRMVHRIDGPIGAYRGFDDGSDRLVMQLNRLADVTILQSQYSLEKHRELGLEPRNPVVIRNAPDPAIFHPAPSLPPRGRRDGPPPRSPRAGRTTPARGPRSSRGSTGISTRTACALTFVGRTPARLEHATCIPPVTSSELAELLREHDAYLAASRDDPCSNALLEALACGLPAVFLRSGGHPELVGEAGLGFDEVEELPALLDRLRGELGERRASITVPRLTDVADRYLQELIL